MTDIVSDDMSDLVLPSASLGKDQGQLEARREVAPPALPGQHVIIDYTNWRGERSMRRIVPNMESLWYGFNDWHKDAQWLLDAYDVEKGDIRTFAMRDIHSWSPVDSVSDGSLKGQDAKRLDPKDNSAVGIHAETPNPSSPVLSETAVEEIIGRLKRNAQILREMVPVVRSMGYSRKASDGLVKTAHTKDEAASLLKAQQDALEEAQQRVDELEDQQGAESETFHAILKWLEERDLFHPRDWPDGIGAQDIISLLIGHESDLLESQNKLDAVQSQLAEKDREIERLKVGREVLVLGNPDLQDQISTLNARLEEVEGAMGADSLIEWLRVELGAIDTWYRGSPPYEHDAGWMKDEVFSLLDRAEKAFPETRLEEVEGALKKAHEYIRDNSLTSCGWAKGVLTCIEGALHPNGESNG